MINIRSLQISNAYSWGLIATMTAGFISLFISAQAGLFVLLYLVFAWWTWDHPKQGLFLFVLAAPILPMFKITQTVANITLIKDVIILTLFTKIFLVRLANKKLPYRRNVLFAPLVALVVWTGLAMLKSDSLLLGILRARDIVLYLLLYMVVLYMPKNKKFMIEILFWFGVSLALVLFFGVYQWFWAVDSTVLRFDPVTESWVPRISSLLAHPSIFGEYLIVPALLAFSFLLYVKDRIKILSVVGVFIIIIPFIYLTYSRGVWIGLAIGILAVVFLRTRDLLDKGSEIQNKFNISLWKTAATVFLLLFVLGVIGQNIRVVSYLKTTVDLGYGSNKERIDFAVRLLAPMSNWDALLGRGLGDVTAQNFREVDLSGYDVATGSAREIQLAKNRTLVDNQHLKTFVEMGLVGLLIYGWVYLRMFKHCYNKERFLSKKRNKIVLSWGAGFLTAFIIQGLFIDIWDIFPTNAYFWMIAAIVSRA